MHNGVIGTYTAAPHPAPIMQALRQLPGASRLAPALFRRAAASADSPGPGGELAVHSAGLLHGLLQSLLRPIENSSCSPAAGPNPAPAPLPYCGRSLRSWTSLGVGAARCSVRSACGRAASARQCCWRGPDTSAARSAWRRSTTASAASLRSRSVRIEQAACAQAASGWQPHKMLSPCLVHVWCAR